MMSRPLLRRALLALLLAGSAAAMAEAPAPLSFDGADPDIEAADGRYYIYPTNSGDASRLHVWTSPDHQHWQKGAELIALDQLGCIGDDGAARHALWAHDMFAANGRHFHSFAVGPQHPTTTRITIVKAARHDKR